MAFGKPKRAKAVAEPRTAEESMTVRARLKEKYPDMVRKTGAWAKPTKSAVGKIKQANRERDASLEEALSPAELKKLGYKG